MQNTWRHLPIAARPIATGVVAAVTAAAQGDDTELAEAVESLAALEQVRVGLVMGVAIRLQLEQLHPDGLTSNDVRDVLTHTTTTHPDADPQVILTLLAGALGVQEEDMPPLKADTSAHQAALLLADLLAGAPPGPLIERTMTDISQTQLDD